MTFWVHIAVEDRPWVEATVFDPPAPAPIPGKGFANCTVEIDGATLYFASPEELRVCIATLSQRVLPSNLILTQQRGARYGPSNHWLNRIPLRSMTWPYRQKIVKYLKLALTDFESLSD